MAVLPIRPAISGRLEATATAPEAAAATDAVVRAVGRQALIRPERPQAKATPPHIELHWSNGRVERVPNRTLRLACSCALCVDEMSRKPVFDPATVPEDIHATELWTIGNYALGVVWAEGHSTNDFPFQMIETLVAEAGK
ncbi:MAG: DUF971 domain-containing protein [Kiritimatiellae bacterium]|nr:DUF971 domain-containing protein [Kiritimatiellia bacterium]MDY0150219.1 DUF971 domain-containing protein [Kiritimatiellia bacterium]